MKICDIYRCYCIPEKLNITYYVTTVISSLIIFKYAKFYIIHIKTKKDTLYDR